MTAENKHATLAINSFIVVSLLYYFLRFQFIGTQSGYFAFFVQLIIPSLSYFAIYFIIIKNLLIRYSEVIKYWSINKVYVIFLLISVFYVVALLRFSYVDSIYSVKNNLTGILLFFVVIQLPGDSLKKILNCITIASALVAVLVIAEYTAVAVLSDEHPPDSKPVLSDGYFAYTRGMNKYALNINEKGHGVTLSFRDGTTRRYARIPGPLGHSNCTPFIFVVGIALSLGMIISNYPLKIKYFVFMLCSLALYINGSKINMLACAASVLVIFSIHYKFMFKRKYIAFLIGTLLSVFALSFLLVDYGAFMKLFNVDQVLRTAKIVYNYDMKDLVDFILRNTMISLRGSGYPPTSPGSYGYALDNKYFLSDDFHIGQLIIQFGIIGSCILAYLFVKDILVKYALLSSKNDIESKPIATSILSIFLAAFVSTLHSPVVSHPQVNPILFILLAIFTVISRDDLKNDLSDR